MTQYSFLNEISLAGLRAGANAYMGRAATTLGKVNPRYINAGAGAVVGATGGALTGLKRDANGERHILRNAAIGAGLGGATGAAFKGKGIQRKIAKFGDNRMNSALSYAAKNPNSRVNKHLGDFASDIAVGY